MQHYKYVIIGGGIAGTTAGETIRACDPDGKIAIVSDEPHNCYSRVLLSKPKWVLGEQPFENVWLKNDAWYLEKKIDLFKGIRATALDAGKKKITLSDGDALTYEKLLLATGAHSRKWTVQGAEKKGVHYLRTLDDAKRLNEVAQGAPKRVVMVGSACVSFEIIEILHERGFDITEVMREKYFFEPQLSREEVAPIEKTLEEKGIKIIREMEIEEVLGGAEVSGVRLSDGRELQCDVILAFIGVELPVEWIKNAGVAVHKGIYANQHLETNVPDIWTAGDTAEGWDVMLEETVIMGNWMSARLQGEVAGKNMTGAREVYEQVSFHSSHGFGYNIGWAGDVRPVVQGKERVVVHIPTDKAGTHCRILLSDGRVVGGTTVNRQDLMGVITSLIKGKKDISDSLEGLQSGAIDIASLK